MPQNPLDHDGGHLFHNVNGIIQVQFIQHLFQLGVGKALNQELLLIAVKLYKDLGFMVEATKKHAAVVKGAFVSEYLMGRLRGEGAEI